MNVAVLAITVGVGIGLVVGALGAGGGILSVPVLVYLLGMDPHTATASSLIIVGITALVSLRHPARAGMVRWRAGAVFGAVALVASAIASRLSLAIDANLLMGLFGVLLCAVCAIMARRAVRTRKAEGTAHPTVASESHAETPSTPAFPLHAQSAIALKPIPLLAAGTLTGTLTGLFGVGGGFMVVPMLTLALRLPIRVATGTSLLIMVMTSAAGLAGRIGTNTVIDWPTVVLFVLGSSVGGILGGPLAARARPSTLTWAFAALVGVLGCVILVEQAIAAL